MTDILKMAGLVFCAVDLLVFGMIAVDAAADRAEQRRAERRKAVERHVAWLLATQVADEAHAWPTEQDEPA